MFSYLKEDQMEECVEGLSIRLGLLEREREGSFQEMCLNKVLRDI